MRDERDGPNEVGIQSVHVAPCSHISRFTRHALWLPTDCFSILLHSPYHRTNPVAHVTPPPKLPSKTMSCGRILPDRTAWSSAIGNDADDVLP